jgi:hypothetical protein
MAKLTAILLFVLLIVTADGGMLVAGPIQWQEGFLKAADYLSTQIYDPPESGVATWGVMNNGWETAVFQKDVYPSWPAYPEGRGTEHPGEYAMPGLVLLKAYQRYPTRSDFLGKAVAIGEYLNDNHDRSAQFYTAGGNSTQGGVLMVYRGEPWHTMSMSHNAQSIMFLTELYKVTGQTAYLTTAEEIGTFCTSAMAVDTSQPNQGVYTGLIAWTGPGSYGSAYGPSSAENALLFLAIQQLDEVSPLSYADWTNGLAQFMASKQNADGSIEGQTGRPNLAAIGWLNEGSPYVANAETLLDWIVAQQGADGSIGGDTRIRENAVPAIAMAFAGRSAEAGDVADWLLSQQNPDGSFPSYNGGTLIPMGTYWAALALYSMDPTYVVPEPATLGLLALGGTVVFIAARARRRHRATGVPPSRSSIRPQRAVWQA